MRWDSRKNGWDALGFEKKWMGCVGIREKMDGMQKLNNPE